VRSIADLHLSALKSWCSVIADVCRPRNRAACSCSVPRRLKAPAPSSFLPPGTQLSPFGMRHLAGRHRASAGAEALALFIGLSNSTSRRLGACTQCRYGTTGPSTAPDNAVMF
jgi:hypothetical protein